MAITISGENNNDRILASDGVIDQISGINIVGVLTATSFAGDVTGNLTGNVTGNINNTTLLLQTGGTERIRITSDGKVGINESTPDWALHISEGSENARIKIERTGTFGVAGVIFKNTIREHHIQTNGSNFVLYDNTASATRFHLDSNGQIGIGTISPTALLHLHKASGDITQKIESSNGAAALELRHTNGYGYINYRQDGAETFRVGQIAQFTSYSVYNPNSSLPYQLCVEGNGEVGINTHNPADTLHLLRNNANHGITLQRAGTNPGTAYVQVHSNGVLSLQGGNNIQYVSGGSQQHIWYRAGTEIARFNTTGNFGIGTNNPSSPFVVSDGDQGFEVHPNSSSTVRLLAYDRTNSVRKNLRIDALAYEIQCNNGTEKVRIDSNGDVLINRATSIDVASTATSKLQVHHGTGNISAAFYSTANALGPSGVLALGHARGSDSGILQDNDVLGQIRFAGGDGNDLETQGVLISAEVNGTPSTNNMPADLVFSTNAGSASVTERLRITSAGLVGIGTVNPISQLHIHSGSPRITMSDSGTGAHHRINADSSVGNFAFDVDYDSTTSTPAFIVNIKGNERLRIKSDGQITHTNFSGIGLHMSGASDPTIRVQDTDGTNQYGDFAHNGGDSYIVTRNNTSHGEFLLYSQNGSETLNRFKLHSNGDISCGGAADNNIYNDSSGGGLNFKNGGQLVISKQATSGADPLVWLNDTGQTTNKFLLFAQDGTEKASIGLAGNDLRFARDGYNETMRITDDGDVSIGGRNAALANYADGSTTPTQLAVVKDGGSAGSGYHEVAHFTGGSDSNDTGAIVRITQFNNDRGLFIKAGRGTSDQAKAIIGLRNSAANDDNWLTLIQNTDQINIHKNVDIDNGANLSIGGIQGHAPLHIRSENTSYGKSAIFGASGWVNSANYHQTDATITLLGRDLDNNDKGAGIEFTTRNTGDTNWLHGAITFGQDGFLRMFTGGAGNYVSTEKFTIDNQGNSKLGTTTPNAFTGGSPTHTQRFLGKKCMQGSVTSTVTLAANGSGTFDLGKLWVTDDTSVELFIQVVRNDATTNVTHYCKAFIQKVRGTGMSQGHILYQNGAAQSNGFTISGIQSGGYTGSGHSSHGTQITVTGGAGGVIYRMVCFYTSISKNDMY